MTDVSERGTFMQCAFSQILPGFLISLQSELVLKPGSVWEATAAWLKCRQELLEPKWRNELIQCIIIPFSLIRYFSLLKGKKRCVVQQRSGVDR